MCCGTEREETVSCPLDCVYLREARKHEKPAAPGEIPNLDIEVTDSFLREHDTLIAFLIQAVAAAGLAGRGAVDYDVREALEGLVRTYRTRESGLYYESRPSNLIAAWIFDRLQENLEEFRRTSTERYGMTVVRDAEILGVLAFLQRVEHQINNGRKRGRAFLDFLQEQHGNIVPPDQPRPGSSLVVP